MQISEQAIIRQEQADQLYERYGQPLEATQAGRYAAISPNGQIVLADTLLEAMDQALMAFGPGNYIFKLGARSVGRWR